MEDQLLLQKGKWRKTACEEGNSFGRLATIYKLLYQVKLSEIAVNPHTSLTRHATSLGRKRKDKSNYEQMNCVADYLFFDLFLQEKYKRQIIKCKTRGVL